MNGQWLIQYCRKNCNKLLNPDYMCTDEPESERMCVLYRTETGEVDTNKEIFEFLEAVRKKDRGHAVLPKFRTRRLSNTAQQRVFLKSLDEQYSSIPTDRLRDTDILETIYSVVQGAGYDWRRDEVFQRLVSLRKPGEEKGGLSRKTTRQKPARIVR